MLGNSREEILTSHYFDQVQEEIKKLLVQPPYNISIDDAQKFNDLVFEQEHEIKLDIQKYVESAINDKKPPIAAKEILAKFYKRININNFIEDTGTLDVSERIITKFDKFNKI